MVVRAYAKLNLMLDILGRTDDGYHTVFMIMQSVGLFDDVTVELTGRHNCVKLTCSSENLPCDKTNIAHKAAKAFFKAMQFEDGHPGVTIHIEKNIPMAAGLAGGSADAAAVLVALNHLFDHPFKREELCAMGKTLGADVPFCLKGGTMAAFDIGQILAPLPPIKDKYIVLVKPGQDVSTKAAYDAFDSAEFIRHCDRDGALHALANGDIGSFYPKMRNVFEQFVEVPDRVTIKATMRDHGALATLMSGSGPSVFGIFENEIRARACASALSQSFKDTFVITPKPTSIEILK